MNKILSSLLFSSLILSAEQTPQDYKQQMMQEFNSYKENLQKEFDNYKAAQMKEFNEYKKEVGAIWDDPKMSSKKDWVLYTDNKKTRSDVDFENQEITIETVAKSPKEAEQNLQIALAKAVTLDTQSAQKIDPLEKRLAKIKKPPSMVTAKIKPKPLLSNVVFNKKPTRKSVQKFIAKNISPKKVKVQKSDKVAHAKVYKVKIKLPSNTTMRLSKQYLSNVKKESKRQDMPISLIFAIMHSESSFNPRARSYVPAYGLMQLVPKTAGIDAYMYLHKEKKLVSSNYLYNSDNNIEMGTAYLHILYHRYLKKIKDPASRMYCTIAAYNTGAGNIAYAFTKKYNLNRAVPLINKMSSQEVYAKLIKDLKYDEAKNYLKKVSKRMRTYKKIYGS